MGTDLYLAADCGNCCGLCCVAPAFAVSPEFALDKPAGQPCPHLQANFQCDIHARLRQEGFMGCTLFDCHGAGQKVSQVTFAGRDWRTSPDLAGQMFAVFAVMRDLHNLLWYLVNALKLVPAAPLHAELTAALEQTERLTHLDAAALVRLDVSAQQRVVGALLLHVGELVRAEVLKAFAAGPSVRWSAIQLARETGLEMASLAPILTRLVRQGWIAEEDEEEDGPEDRHSVYRIRDAASPTDPGW
jgi:DNA-binding MarR family transcriptional regulator